MPEFEFRGTEEMMELIGMLPDLAVEAAEPAMGDALDYLHSMLPDYPPQREGSRYRRTGTLGRRFTTEVIAGSEDVIGRIGTNLAYAPWVVGPDYPGEEIGGRMMYQARVLVDRWWQFNDVVEANIEGAWTEFEKQFWPDFRAQIEQQVASQQTGGRHA